MSVTSGQRPEVVLSFTSAANAARTAPCRSRPISYRLSRTTSTVGLAASPTPRDSQADGGLSRWPANAALFVGRDGERITRGTIQSRVRRAFRRAGPNAQPVHGALVHGLRHTYVTELANSGVSVYTLMKLLGHESMPTSQRYVTGAARETRTAAA